MGEARDIKLDVSKMTKDYQDAVNRNVSLQSQTTQDRIVSLNDGANRYIGMELNQESKIVSLLHGHKYVKKDSEIGSEDFDVW